MSALNQIFSSEISFKEYQKIIPIGDAKYIVQFTGQSNPDDETTQYNYTITKLDGSPSQIKDVVVDSQKRVIAVSSDKLTPREARALQSEGICVSNVWIFAQPVLV